MKQKIYYNAAVAGAGKTKYNMKNIVKNLSSNPRAIQIHISPSVDNAREKAETFEENFPDCNVYFFHKEDDSSVVSKIADIINDIRFNNFENNILSITAAAYNIAKQWGLFDDLVYDLYIDEEQSIIQNISLDIGNTTLTNVIANITSSPASKNFSTISSNNTTYFNSILKQKDSMTINLRNLANSLVNDNLFSTFVKTHDINKYINGSTTFYNNSLDIRIMTKPEMYAGARNTYITAAFFKETLFYKTYKNDFDFIDETPAEDRLHKNGDRITIKNFSDTPISRYKNDIVEPLTGNKNVDNVLEYIIKNVDGNTIIYDNTYRLKDHKKYAKNGVYLTNTNVIGLNHLTDYKNSACLATFNPSSDDTLFAKEILDMDYDNLLETRLYTIYQCMFRDNSRVKDSNENIIWYVFDLLTALYLSNHFDKNNQPKIVPITEEIYFDKKICMSRDAVETKNNLLKNANRKHNKKTVIYKNDDKIKLDNSVDIIHEMFNNKESYSFLKKESNAFVFSIPNSHITDVEKILKENKISHYMQISKIGNKNAKLVIPFDKTLSSDMYDIMGEYIAEYVFNNKVTLSNINSVIYTDNVIKRCFVREVFSTKKILKDKRFRNFVTYYVQVSINDDKNTIFSIYDFTVLSSVVMNRVVKNIKKISGLSEQTVINKILTSHTKLQAMRIKSLL